ncbi:MAG: hypothetical protein RL616_1119 [Verrucomicrobiota bacterium]|jgi:hypothetical protein
MKKSKSKSVAGKSAATITAPAFQVAVRQRVKKAVVPAVKVKTRENTFSKSRDTREDRGARQMKTAHSSQTFPHAR